MFVRRGKGSRFERGPGSWYSHAQTAHRTRHAQTRTPSRAGTACALPLSKEVQEEGGGFPGKRGVPAGMGAGVPARGVLQPVRGQEAWEHYKPSPNEPDPSHFNLATPTQGENGRGGMRHLCGKSMRTRTSHKRDTCLPRATFVASESKLIASLVRHLLVAEKRRPQS